MPSSPASRWVSGTLADVILRLERTELWAEVGQCGACGLRLRRLGFTGRSDSRDCRQPADILVVAGNHIGLRPLAKLERDGLCALGDLAAEIVLELSVGDDLKVAERNDHVGIRMHERVEKDGGIERLVLGRIVPDRHLEGRLPDPRGEELVDLDLDVACAVAVWKNLTAGQVLRPKAGDRRPAGVRNEDDVGNGRLLCDVVTLSKTDRLARVVGGAGEQPEFVCADEAAVAREYTTSWSSVPRPTSSLITTLMARISTGEVGVEERLHLEPFCA